MRGREFGGEYLNKPLETREGEHWKLGKKLQQVVAYRARDEFGRLD